jgi:hypothetical protein
MVSLRDERGVIIDWLGKVLLVVAILGAIAYEGGAVVVNYFTLDSKANEIALEIATDIQGGVLSENNDQEIEAATRTLAKDAGARLVAYVYDRDNDIFHVTLKRSANTLIVSRLDATKDWAVARSNGQAPTQ